jgi:signal transduction histidine kinase
MKIFDQAVWRLTAIYSLILLVLSLSFSTTFFLVADGELNRLPGPRTENLQRQIIYQEENFQVFISEQGNQMRQNLLMHLVFINLTVLVGGAVASYFLARLTLKPIDQAMTAQGRFVSDASHELRTPLSAIQMENEVTLRAKTASKAELQNQIKSNLEEVGKLRQLTDRLLKLSRDEPIKLTSVNIKLAADESVRRLQTSAHAKQIVVKNLVKTQHWQANQAALTDILAILLDNAIKFSPNKSVVTLDCQKGLLTVCDQGPGIAEADLPHIFDRFYRSEQSRTSDGYGLGLPLAKQLAEKMNLKISVSNNSDKGANFSLTP